MDGSLQDILKKHKEWLESGGERGVQLDFAGADLRGALFHLANFDGANLAGSSFQKANLRFSDLRNADLTGAKTNRKTRLPSIDAARPAGEEPKRTLER